MPRPNVLEQARKILPGIVWRHNEPNESVEADIGWIRVSVHHQGTSWVCSVSTSPYTDDPDGFRQHWSRHECVREYHKSATAALMGLRAELEALYIVLGGALGGRDGGSE